MDPERQLKRIIESSDVEMDSQSSQEPFKKLKKASTFDSADEEMEFEDYELDTNPFLIEPVLKVLFGQMSLANLKQARLVSSLWNQKVVEELENLSRSQYDKSIKKIKVDQNLSLDKFYGEIQNHQIFTRFRVYTPHQLDTICVNFPEKNVLINFTPTHLSIVNSYMNLNTVNWCEIRPKILPNSCNSLRKLEIKNIFKCQNFLSESNVRFQFPNLVKFSFEYDKNEVGENYNKFIETVLENSSQLTCLKIQSFPVNQDFVEILCRRKCYEKITKLYLGEWLIHTNQFSRINLDKISGILRLKDLKIEKFKFIGSEGINAFNYFVQSQRLYLKSLNLNFEFLDTVPELKVNFPKFENLQSVTLKNSTERWAEILEPFSFSEKFPHVENLCLNEMKFFDKICTEGSTNVKTLKIHGHRVNPLDFSQIQKWFPNISDFFVESQIFPNYCQEIGWSQNLKILAIEIHTIEQLHNLKLDHLKGLETLKIVFSYNYFYTWELNTVKILSKKSTSFLKGLDNLLSLNCLKKFHLKFVGFKQGGVQEFSQEVVQKVQDKFANTKIDVEIDL